MHSALSLSEAIETVAACFYARDVENDCSSTVHVVAGKANNIFKACHIAGKRSVCEMWFTNCNLISSLPAHIYHIRASFTKLSIQYIVYCIDASIIPFFIFVLHNLGQLTSISSSADNILISKYIVLNVLIEEHMICEFIYHVQGVFFELLCRSLPFVALELQIQALIYNG